MLSFSMMYCKKCDRWYSPLTVSECIKCPICGSDVIGDE